MRLKTAIMLVLMMGAQQTVSATEQAAAAVLDGLRSGSDDDDEGGSYAELAPASPAKVKDKQKRRMPHRKRALSSRKGMAKSPGLPAEERRVKYEQLPSIDTNNLDYEGEGADRRCAIRWIYRALGSPEPGPDEENWKGANGTVSVICNRLGLKMASSSASVRETLRGIDEGRDVRLRQENGRLGARKMTPCDIGVAADCLEAGLGLQYAAWQVGARRYSRALMAKRAPLTEEEEKIARVSPECVRQTCQRAGADVHRRQTKKSGSSDTTAAWAKASLAQAKQMRTQLLAGTGDRNAIRDCRREGWKQIKLEQVAFWDERHRKVILGCASKYEWRFLVDKNHPGCRIIDPNDPRGVLPEPMPITTAKYLSEARRSFGVALKIDAEGNQTGHRFRPYNYTSQLMIGLEKYNQKVQAEVRRAEDLKGGEWAGTDVPKAGDVLAENMNIGLNLDPDLLESCDTVRDLPGGRYQARWPGPVRAGNPDIDGPGAELLAPREEWKWQVRSVLGRGNSPVVCVTDMMDHIISEGDKFYKGTEFENTWIIGHDHLSQWWSKESLAYLHSRGFDEQRYLCCEGETNKGNRHYEGSLVGNRPELMPLDSHLNADHERGMKHHIALTSILENDDAKKFKMGTPTECGESMDRTWEVYPTAERIVSDINKFPRALQAIIDHEGAVVPEMDNRSGRRKDLHKSPPHHEDCERAIELRREKWDREEVAYGALQQQLSSEEEDDDDVSDDD